MRYDVEVMFTRRSVLSMAAAAAIASAKDKKIPVGIEMYSVRGEQQKDLIGTVKAVAKMGYDGLEFFSPYYQWTPDQTKEMRKLLDDLGIKCFSTHNGIQSFSPEGIQKAIDYNSTLGSKYIVLASAGRVNGPDGWKGVAEKLTAGNEKMKSAGLHPGYHNHQLEFKPVEGKRPIEIIADNTPKDVMLQLDVGTCVEVGSDPVAWINTHPGRIKGLHLKEWSPTEGYKALFAEGAAPWKKIFEAAEKKGGVEYYLIEQEGSRFSELETAERCLATYRKMRA